VLKRTSKIILCHPTPILLSVYLRSLLFVSPTESSRHIAVYWVLEYLTVRVLEDDIANYGRTKQILDSL
jgi:hypothetical protein